MIIDFHTHVFPSFLREERKSYFKDESAFASLYSSSKAKMIGVSDLLKSMNEDEITKSVIFGFPWENADIYRRHNDYIIESVKKYSGRFIGFCCFSPLATNAAREVERCLSSGLMGVGELAFYGSGLTTKLIEALKDVMNICAEFDVPVMVHTNEPVGHSYAGKTSMTLREIYGFVKTYPLNRIVLAHWGGGIFFYSLMKKDVNEAFKNVWFDTAASPYLYNPDIYRLAGEILGYNRILFGSDYPLIKPHQYLDEMASAGIPRNAIDRITGINAAELLGLRY
jgi:predicted TIM-barrel fold metal-dependent hydrolase